ncbi:MAG: negative modulator of initiation of replication [Paraglaciecola sp.]|jgi:negative modulator of initiation of replication
MKSIEIDDDLYVFIASQTQHIGESATDILRRLIMPESVVAGVIRPARGNTPFIPTPIGNEMTFSHIEQETLNELSKIVDRFLYILAAIYRVHSEHFDLVLQVQGPHSLYFAKDKESLIAVRSTTNPKQIPDSGFWIVSNNNTARKISILSEVADVFGYSATDKNRLLALFCPPPVDQ